MGNAPPRRSGLDSRMISLAARVCRKDHPMLLWPLPQALPVCSDVHVRAGESCSERPAPIGFPDPAVNFEQLVVEPDTEMLAKSKVNPRMAIPDSTDKVTDTCLKPVNTCAK